MEVFNTAQKHLRRAINLVGGQLALAIEQATQGQITRSQLRSDIYPECPSELKACNL